MNKSTVWVWMCVKGGLVLFHGNPNHGCPPYHGGSVSNLLMGKDLVWGYTKRELESEFDKAAWRRRFPQFKVKPVKITIEIKPYVKEVR